MSDRLEEFYGLLAHHYSAAELWEKAQEYLFKAGDQAGRMAADAEAHRVWVNSADDPANCSVTLPAKVRQGVAQAAGLVHGTRGYPRQAMEQPAHPGLTARRGAVPAWSKQLSSICRAP